MNDKESVMCENFCDAAKGVIREIYNKYILGKKKRPKINNLSIHTKKLEKNSKPNPKKEKK